VRFSRDGSRTSASFTSRKSPVFCLIARMRFGSGSLRGGREFLLQPTPLPASRRRLTACCHSRLPPFSKKNPALHAAGACQWGSQPSAPSAPPQAPTLTTDEMLRLSIVSRNCNRRGRGQTPGEKNLRRQRRHSRPRPAFRGKRSCRCGPRNGLPTRKTKQSPGEFSRPANEPAKTVTSFTSRMFTRGEPFRRDECVRSGHEKPPLQFRLTGCRRIACARAGK